MPFFDNLTRMLEHLVPVFSFHRAALATQIHPSNELVASDEVMIVDGNEEAALPDVIVRNFEHKRCVIYRVQRLFDYFCLSFLDFSAFVMQPNFNIWI